ncbi:hypothetical protein BDQ94DRAFT_155086 [Aspergillus welwitschiae]|uniref:Uncharacterized protein n=1 Tax=Aspergillus welwitschiae TaxID=1341132 RepID=A0A3F3PK28_9EURO|nr:hypothetical protein BDQ94DRAFT_155086 [Aspergillus welwitschiae]RDH26716.1 hypothetical protein BDQ94DRAFT_155086 [Aspergillus welwitschiae]
MASRERSASTILLLLGHGSEVIVRNKYGRTAPMEASLWSGLETTKILLSRNTDRYLHDKRNLRAFDLAQLIRKSRRGRYDKAGSVWGNPSTEPIYKEDVHNRDADRRKIARIVEAARPHFLERPVDRQCPKQIITPSGDLPMTSQSSIAVQFESIPYLNAANQ